jgi:hypothetical protein
MRFVCGKQECPGLGLRGAACEKCGLALTVGSLCRYSVRSLWSFVRRAFSVSCPRCRAPIPAFQAACASCGNTVTVEQAVDHTVGPHRAKVKEFVAPTKTKKWLFQFSYLVISALGFWRVLAHLEKQFAQDWVKHASLSVVYLAVFLLISLWIVPQRTLIIIGQRASKIIKLALVFNYLTALFFFQMFLASWWARSLMLGALFVATWAGAWVFWRFLWPMAATVSGMLNPRPRSFDPRDPQAKTIRFD